jgi:hypothetical protein
MIPQARTIEHGTLFQRVLFTAGLLISSLPATAQQANKATEEAAKPAAEIARPAESEVITLSPFVVTADDNQGYQATSTLAGSRLRTQLKDVAASIQVFTPELLSDIGATDAGTALGYGLNTEVGGLQGNFTGATSADGGQGRTSQDEARTNPQGTQRIRGIGAASLTRNFFLTDIPFDVYNASNITINRGPNSILFGVGSASGIIDAGLNRATLGRDQGEVVLRGGKNESFRTSLNFNHVLIKDRLALRVAALNAKENANQKPSFQADRRLYLDLQAVLFENKKSTFLGSTTLRANSEWGTINSNPPMIIPPKVTYNTWWSGVTTNFTKYTGVVVPTTLLTAANGGTYVPQSTIAGTLGTSSPFAQRPFFFAPAIVYGQPGVSNPQAAFGNFPNADGYVGDMLTAAGAAGTPFRTFWTKAPETTATYGNGFAPPVLQNRNSFDYVNQLFTGDTNRVLQNFRVFNASLEQLFFKDNRAGIELAYGKEELNRNALLVGSDRVFSVYADSDVSIDLMQNLPTGEANPNVGKVAVRIQNLGQSSTREIAHETARATAFYRLDFTKLSRRWNWLGTHTLTGLLEQSENSAVNRGYSMVWDTTSATPITSVYAGGFSNASAQVTGLVYLNNVDARTLSGPDQVKFGPINLTIPRAGETYQIVYQDLSLSPALRKGTYKTIDLITKQIASGGDINKKIINSRAFTVQSKLLWDTVDTIFGWRHDTARTYGALTPDQLLALTGSSGSRDASGIWRPENFIYQNAPTSIESGSTFTSSAVVHLPEKWTSFVPLKPGISLLFGASQNFDPQGVRRNAYGDTLASPLGKTKEMGIAFDFGPKLSIRINRYESSAALATGSIGVGAAQVAGRVGTFLIQRGVIDPQNQGWTFAQTKVEMLKDFNGNAIADPIPQVNSFDAYFKLLNGLLPTSIGSKFNYQVVNTGGIYQLVANPVDNQQATTDLTSKGLEIEVVSNPIKGLRLMLNVAKQATLTNNTGQDFFDLANTILANMTSSGVYTLRDSPVNAGNLSAGDRYTTDILTNIIAARSKDGTVSQEQRKWRANLVANYSFAKESKLKGFGVGAGARWQDKGTIGYGQIILPSGLVAPDLSQPYYAPAQLNGDLFASYRRKVTKKIDWKLQVNFRNAFGNHSDIPIRANPDGSVPIVRIPLERTWFITNTFSF